MAYRHLPTGSSYSLLDFRFAGMGPDNRWNEPGERTLYLAGDRGILLAEWGRHFDVDRTAALQPELAERTVYRLMLRIEHVLDLRAPETWQALSLDEAPTCFLDRAVARATARYLRRTTTAQALLVPSVAMLDQAHRWNLVVFLDKLPEDPARFITAWHVEGSLQWGAGDSSRA